MDVKSTVIKLDSVPIFPIPDCSKILLVYSQLEMLINLLHTTRFSFIFIPLLLLCMSPTISTMTCPVR